MPTVYLVSESIIHYTVCKYFNLFLLKLRIKLNLSPSPSVLYSFIRILTLSLLMFLETHQQRLRSKTRIPILVGKPPYLPITKPSLLTNEWKRQAKYFANYFLILYRPWTETTKDGGTLPGNCSWYALCRHMRYLEGIDVPNGPSFLNVVRLKWISNAAHGLRITASDRRASQKYRCRSATAWNTPDGTESLKKR